MMPPNGGNNGKQPAENNYQPGDDECRACIGISLLTAGMRDSGRIPMCLGVSSVLNKRIPLEQLEQLNKENQFPDLGVAIIIGYTRSSGLMDRTGRVPVCIRGLQLHVARRMAPKSPHQQNDADAQMVAAGGSLAAAAASKGIKSSRKEPLALPSLTDAMQNLQRLMRKGVNKQWNSMTRQLSFSKSVLASTAKDFPRKFAKGSSNLISAMDKLLRTTIQKIFRGGN